MANRLGDALEQLPTPDATGRRDETVRAAAALSRHSSPDQPRKTGRRGALALGLVLLLTGLSFTPPGRAVTSDLGELVGIGEPSTFDHSSVDDLPAIGPAVVVASGTIPGSDQPFEVAAFASESERRSRGEGASGPLACLSFDLLEIDKPSEASFNTVCVDRAPNKALFAGGFSDYEDRLGSEARFTLEGQVTTEVARVEVSYEPEPGERVQAPVVLATITEEIAAETGAPAEFGAFYGFIPDNGAEAGFDVAAQGPAAASMKVRAFDADGEELGFEAFGQGLVSRERRAQEEQAEQQAAIDGLTSAYADAAETVRAGELAAEVDPDQAARVIELTLASLRGELSGPPIAQARREGIRFKAILKELRAAGDLPK